MAVVLEPPSKPASDLLTHKKSKAAYKLLEQVGRRLGPPRTPLSGRDVAPLSALLGGRERVSLVLIGPQGSGKSALMQAAAAAQGRPARTVIATSGAELVAGQSGIGQLEQRVEEVMKAAELLNAVLYFESLDDLFAGRPGGYEDFAGLMQRYVEAGRVRVVGEVTAEQFDRLAHRHVGFFSRLHRFPVAPLSRDETLRALEARSSAHRASEQPFLADGVATLIVDAVERYDPYRALPGKAITFFEELCARRRAEPRLDDSLDLRADDVFVSLSVLTGMPESLLRDEQSLQIREVERFLHQRVVGQTQAVRHVAETVCSIKAGLQVGGKPLAAFLFVGPTGVGKTELAKALASFLFGSETRLTRFDMSEYMDVFAAERLIRGTDRDDGLLTRRVREHLFGVLLLDEIEKADPAVFDLLLQVLGEGRLSDARGRVSHFRNFIVIMTSNVGSEQSRRVSGFGATETDAASHYVSRVRERFRPEFINRLDRIVSFHSLTREEIAEVTQLSLRRIARRDGFEQGDIALCASPEALAYLADQGYSAAYGARGLRRHLERALVAPMASLLAGLAARAQGSLLVALSDAEARDAARVVGGLGGTAFGAELARETRAGLTFVAYARPRREKRDVSPVLEVSALRREARSWLALSPIGELRERLQELDAQLAEAGRTRRARSLARVLGEVAAESGRIRALLEPLDRALSELEDIESLLIASLHDSEEPGILAPEAKAAHARIKQRLIPALYARTEQHEIALSIHEIDDRRVLHDLLLPLLEAVRERGWSARLHLDRAERVAEDAWPKEHLRRFGPPRAPELYLERYAEPDAARPFQNVLLCLKGHAAGALLATAAGRYRYRDSEGFGELVVRVVAPRFLLEESDWTSHATDPDVDRGVARKQHLRFELAKDASVLEFAPGRRVFEDLDPKDLFRRWEEVCFEELVAPFRPGGSASGNGLDR